MPPVKLSRRQTWFIWTGPATDLIPVFTQDWAAPKASSNSISSLCQRTQRSVSYHQGIGDIHLGLQTCWSNRRTSSRWDKAEVAPEHSLSCNRIATCFQVNSNRKVRSAVTNLGGTVLSGSNDIMWKGRLRVLTASAQRLQAARGYGGGPGMLLICMLLSLSALPFFLLVLVNHISFVIDRQIQFQSLTP